MHSVKKLLAGLLGMMMAAAWAEPAIQPGDTLESLAQAKISVTVRDQVQSEKTTEQPTVEEQSTGSEVRVEDIDAPVLE
ncbi:hypothetical protein [Acinetobacter chinensis]|uniref:hypothetical protein n=1 Tax=Acinetobacter chinensis TaxID=2004650 RepID=UPI00293431DD|nr:hypothetical protein [Acinetobacter chinensis]WOE41661.1 hypothetical protein QSG87_00425 [Acinetobacter chinensis]